MKTMDRIYLQIAGLLFVCLLLASQAARTQAQEVDARQPRLAYVLPTHQAVLYLYEAPPGAMMQLVTCEIERSGSWFGSKPWELVVLNANPLNKYVSPTIYRVTVSISGNLYLLASPATLTPGRVLVSLDDGVTWQTLPGPECRNTVILPAIRN